MATRGLRLDARPVGYPAGWESDARLADGRVVRIAPIVPADAAELAEAIRTADADTVHARFLGAAPPLTDAVLRRLTCVDYVTRFALVARSGGRGVAIARYESLPPDDDGTRTAEIAVAVRPEWRGVGLAGLLIGLLARRADECGISRFDALFAAQNVPVAEIARRAHAHVVITDGTAHLEAPVSHFRDEEDEP